MAVDFNFTDSQYIDFGAINNGLTNKTVISWINPVSFTASFFHAIGGRRSTTDPGFSLGIEPASAMLWYHESYATSPGNWRSTTAITTGVPHMLATTHDGTTAAPLMYLDGASMTVIQVTAPSGSLNSDAAKPLVVGNYAEAADGTKSLNGRIYNFLVYNRIMTASEIAEAFASKLVIPTIRGLVFAALLRGAAGLQVFDGAAMAAGNTIADHISGALGVPTGDPVGRGDTVLTWEGMA